MKTANRQGPLLVDEVQEVVSHGVTLVPASRGPREPTDTINRRVLLTLTHSGAEGDIKLFHVIGQRLLIAFRNSSLPHRKRNRMRALWPLLREPRRIAGHLAISERDLERLTEDILVAVFRGRWTIGSRTCRHALKMMMGDAQRAAESSSAGFRVHKELS